MSGDVNDAHVNQNPYDDGEPKHNKTLQVLLIILNYDAFGLNL